LCSSLFLTAAPVFLSIAPTHKAINLAKLKNPFTAHVMRACWSLRAAWLLRPVGLPLRGHGFCIFPHCLLKCHFVSTSIHGKSQSHTSVSPFISQIAKPTIPFINRQICHAVSYKSYDYYLPFASTKYK
jgi:hypothetical protein